MKPGSDIACGRASSLTGRSDPLSDIRMWRRVGSASAPNTALSVAEDLTTRFTILPLGFRVKNCLLPTVFSGEE